MNLTYDEALSHFAFNFNLRRYYEEKRPHDVETILRNQREKCCDASGGGRGGEGGKSVSPVVALRALAHQSSSVPFSSVKEYVTKLQSDDASAIQRSHDEVLSIKRNIANLRAEMKHTTA